MLDAAPAALSGAQLARLQLVGYVSSAASLIGVSYVLLHLLHQRWRGRPRKVHMDFPGKLVLVLSLFDLAALLARVAGRAPVGNAALCDAQAALLQAASLGSCIWVCCIAFNLYRWLVKGESGAARQARFRLYLAIATLPSLGLVAFHLASAWAGSVFRDWRLETDALVVLAARKYGDATFYCWLREIQYMFLTFYSFYVAMVVFNFVLLILIHVNMKQRVARCGLVDVGCCSYHIALTIAVDVTHSHDTIEADTSSMLIRRKLLLYIVVFIVHRSPMMIYRCELVEQQCVLLCPTPSH